MKKTIFFLLLASCLMGGTAINFATGKTNTKHEKPFEKQPYYEGWDDGYCEGWKDVKGKMAYCPYPPYPPYPQYPKSVESYRDGYNDGFKRGMKDAENSQ